MKSTYDPAKLRHGYILCLILIVGTGLRAIWLLTPWLWKDEAIVGIMSLHALQGKFPIFFYGQAFMGSIEAYINALVFMVFGSSVRTLEVSSLVVSVSMIYLTYLVGRRFFDRATGLLAALFVAIPPTYIMKWSHEARLHYGLTPAFGMVMFLLSHSIVCGNRTARGKNLLYAILGVVAGLAWWTNMLSVYYLAAIATFLMVMDVRWRILGLKPWLGIVGFFIGGLPLWVYNLKHEFGTFTTGRFFDLQNILPNLKALWQSALSYLLWVPTPSLDASWKRAALYFIIAAYSLSMIWVAQHAVSRIRKADADARKRAFNQIFLVGFICAVLVLNITSIYGTKNFMDNDQRYILPILNVLPITAAFLIVSLWRRSRALSGLLLGGLLFTNAYSLCAHGMIIFNEVELTKCFARTDEYNTLYETLKAKGIRAGYANEYIAKESAFRWNEDILLAHPYSDQLCDC